MAKKNNVNPDHYKTAGRSRQGEDILQEVHRKKYAEAQEQRTRRKPPAEAKPKKETPPS